MFTDLFIYFLIIILICRGALRGFLASLLDPISVVLATAAAYYLLQNTHSIPLALGIGLLGPFFIYNIFKGLFITGNPPSISSRIIGAFITLIWGLIFLLPMIYLLTFLPPVHPVIKTAQKDIKASVIIASLSKEFDARLFPKKEIPKKSTPIKTTAPTNTRSPVINAPNDTLSKEEFIKDPNINTSNPHHIDSLEEFLSDPRIVDVRSDPQIKTAIEQKNYAVLMSNPKIMKLMQDPEFIKRMMQELKVRQEAGDIPATQ